MAEVSYLINVFPLDANTAIKIHIQIFKYLWHDQISEAIARETIFLRKTSDG